MRLSRLLICALLPVTLLLAGPAHLYFTNAAEFSAPFADHLRYLAPSALVLFLGLGLALVACERRPRTGEFAVALLFALSALVWLQGNVLVFDYGPLDGRGIQWHGKRVQASVELAVWATVLVAALVWRRATCRWAVAGSAALLLIQLGTVAFEAATADRARTWKPAAEMRVALHTLAPERNVIVLIVDTFQADVFKALLERRPSLAGRLEGFTLFANTTGGYPTTAASLPMMLTGQTYENAEPVADFVQRELAENSLASLFLERGYQVDLMPLTRYVMSCNQAFASNCIELRRVVQDDDLLQAFDETTRLLDVTAFRHVPHVLKPFVHNDGNWVVSDALEVFGVDAVREGHWLDTAFIEQFRTGAVVSDELPGTFKLYHLIGLHPPFRLNESCQERAVDQTHDKDVQRAIALTQAGCVFDYIEVFLDRLRELGVFDQSLIVIAGDHGSSGPLHVGVDARVMQPGVDVSTAHDGGAGPVEMAEEVMASAMPMLLVKRPGAKGPLTVRQAPVALCDLPNTVAGALGFEPGFPCQDAFSIADNADRERRYLFYRWDDDFWQKDYLPNMHEYLVNGPPWQRASWSASPRLLTPNGVSTGSFGLYSLGETLSFGVDGSVTPYLGRGWTVAPGGETWALRPKAALTLALGRDAATTLSGTLALQVGVKHAAPDHNAKPLQVNVIVNDVRAGTMSISGPGQYEVAIPAKRIGKYGRLRIRFETAYREGAREAGANDPSRDLAFSPQTLVLQPPATK